MSDVLRRVYEGCGALDRYFEGKTPVALYRGRPFGDSSDPMQPTLIGWYTRLRPRNPDVLLLDDRSRSPQYVTGLTNGDLLTEDRQQRPVTAEILRNADKLIVKGCRTMSGCTAASRCFTKPTHG